MTADEITAALAEPFDANEIKWKPAMVKGDRCLVLAYVDARVVQDRLDDVLGVTGWTESYTLLPNGSVACKLAAKIGGEWVTKEDVGSESEQPDGGDRMKAAYSDALKRAAVKLGVGRFLYRLPQQWVAYDATKKRPARTPDLPEWARKAPAAKPAPSSNGAAPKADPAPTSEPAADPGVARIHAAIAAKRAQVCRQVEAVAAVAKAKPADEAAALCRHMNVARVATMNAAECDKALALLAGKFNRLHPGGPPPVAADVPPPVAEAIPTDEADRLAGDLIDMGEEPADVLAALGVAHGDCRRLTRGEADRVRAKVAEVKARNGEVKL